MGRKWNIVVKGVEGNTKETPRETDHKVRSFFVTSLKLDDRLIGGMIFQAVHRLPPGDPSKRIIIVRLNSLIDKEDVMQAVRKPSKGSGYRVIPDLNPTANKLRILGAFTTRTAIHATRATKITPSNLFERRLTLWRIT
ncbi:hypothetical protein FSP39_013026 [Pinctada imbricata]|uniref:Uncharacterized protein n=1 Tax=Pinctada imbricata TaxID=66713 RepID=A0AA89C799_PINIB|nr:hypothetical protein FSP39_013026 [Pinctada imbricata]